VESDRRSPPFADNAKDGAPSSSSLGGVEPQEHSKERPCHSEGRGGLRGEEVAEFAVEEGAVARVHGDDLKGHAGLCMNAADDGAAANLSCGGVQQELNGTAKRHGPLGAYEEAPECEAVHVGDVAGHAGLAGDDERFRGTNPRIFALVRSGH